MFTPSRLEYIVLAVLLGLALASFTAYLLLDLLISNGLLTITL